MRENRRISKYIYMYVYIYICIYIYIYLLIYMRKKKITKRIAPEAQERPHSSAPHRWASFAALAGGPCRLEGTRSLWLWRRAR